MPFAMQKTNEPGITVIEQRRYIDPVKLKIPESWKLEIPKQEAVFVPKRDRQKLAKGRPKKYVAFVNAGAKQYVKGETNLRRLWRSLCTKFKPEHCSSYSAFVAALKQRGHSKKPKIAAKE